MIGGDGKVYRWRFVGGAWSNWIQLASSFGFNPNTFGEASASYSQNGEVDLVAVRNQAGTLLYHRHIEPRDDNFSQPNKPAQTFQSIGSRVVEQPFTTFFSPSVRNSVCRFSVRPSFGKVGNKFQIKILRSKSNKCKKTRFILNIFFSAVC